MQIAIQARFKARQINEMCINKQKSKKKQSFPGKTK